MTTATLTLSEFLLARIAEDEATARRATGADRTGNWWLDPDEGGVTEVSCLDVQGFITAADVDAAHIARHDPARILAECEAKRRIVEWAAPVLTNWPGAPKGFRYVSDDGLDLLRILATVYSDHPDHQQEWRP